MSRTKDEKKRVKNRCENSEFVTRTTITREFFIDCVEMNSYKLSLQEKIRNLSECDQNCGYILSADPDSLKILNNTISPDYSGVNFNVEFSVETIKPKKGRVFHGVVCMIISAGVLVDIEEKIKILIPQNKLKEYKYQENPSRFVKEQRKRQHLENENLKKKIKVSPGEAHPKKGKEEISNIDVIQQFSAVDVCIEDIEYVNGKYNCIGVLAI